MITFPPYGNVIGGTLNRQGAIVIRVELRNCVEQSCGAIVIRVERAGDDSTLVQIVNLVRDAQASSAFRSASDWGWSFSQFLGRRFEL
ncbi:hypothetical protein T484DRAFT_1848589 [Baffinella frigidus]|nr:hypothetical protein T484DRAFT_1848589 [Cryptophyta sp. CCMP2293]